MKKAPARALCALVFFLMLLPFTALAQGLEIGTTVSITVEGFEITSQTEDCAIQVGSNLELKVGIFGTAILYRWERSTDGGTSWKQVAATPTYEIVNARQNTPADVPYQYRVTATNDQGSTVEAIICVLVSDEYAYRSIALRNGDTEVSSYMHDDTRLVVTPIPDSVPAATVLESELADSCLPLLLYDVSLVNQNNEVVPYYGTVEVRFHVGSSYDGMTLRVFHFHDDTVTVYSGVVVDGVLTINVTGLSPFLVEIPDENTHTITVNAGAGGSVTPSGTVNVGDGADKTFTFLPNVGYEVSAVTEDDVPVTITGNSFTLSNITENKTVFVRFRPVTPSETLHTVTINAQAHGSVYPSGKLQVRHGSAQTVYFYPNDHFELDTVTVNGTKVNVIGNSYTLSAVTGDTALTATFRQGTAQPPDVFKTISASAGANGSISPFGNVSLEYGGDMYFYFLPNDGYAVDAVCIDGVETAVSGHAYHFVNVVDAHTISVTFKQIVTPPTYHTITADSGANGSIRPGGSIQVAEGDAQTFRFIPNANYEIDAVTIDGVTTDVSGSAYTFPAITADHTIHVTFKRTVTPPPPTAYYTISAGSGSHGTISPDGDAQIAEGGSVSFCFLPDEGFEVDAVTVDGKTIAAEERAYCFADVDADHTIFVTFKEAAATPEPTVFYSISVLAEGNGSISPSGDVQVAEGGSQTFYLIADDGYAVEGIYVNGEKQDVVGGQFTLDGVTGDTELRVIFQPIRVPISSDAPHCFICGWASRNIAPWCWLVPLIIVISLGGALWLRIRKRRRQSSD